LIAVDLAHNLLNKLKSLQMLQSNRCLVLRQYKLGSYLDALKGIFYYFYKNSENKGRFITINVAFLERIYYVKL